MQNKIVLTNLGTSRKKSNAQNYKGRWQEIYFENYGPLILELGCGKGEYVLALAELFPDRNYIGIDRDQGVIWEAAKFTSEENLINAAFIHSDLQNLNDYFNENEISEIWLTFPDVQHDQNFDLNAITSVNFLNLYRNLLRNGGLIHLKTEDMDFFDYSSNNLNRLGFSLISKTYDIYNIHTLDPLLSIKTSYELDCIKDRKKINYLCYKFDGQ
jgi:tRNA (guanine-N7-)-methyltransferase